MKDVIRTCLTISVCFFLADNAFPQTWPPLLTSIPKNLSALSTSTVTQLHQESERSLLIATTDRIFQYDGSQLKDTPVDWSLDSKLPVAQFISFFTNSSGETLAATKQDGILKKSRYDSKFQKLELSYPDHFDVYGENHTIDSVEFFERLKHVALTNNEIHYYDQHDKSLEGSPTVINGNQKEIIAIEKLDDRRFVAVTDDALFVEHSWTEKGFIADDYADCSQFVSSPTVITKASNSSDRFLVADKAISLVVLRVSDGQCLQEKRLSLDAIGGARISDIVTSEFTSEFAVLSDRGIALIEGDRIYVVSTANSSIKSNQILTAISVSRNKWLVGTYKGLYQISRSDFTKVTRHPSDSNPLIVAISGGHHRTFAASYNAIFEIKTTANGLSFDRLNTRPLNHGVTAFFADEQYLITGHIDGSMTIMPAERPDADAQLLPHSIHQVSESPISAIARLDENTFLIGTFGSGLQVRKNDFTVCHEGAISLSPNPLSDKIIGFKEISTGSVLIFTMKGAYRLNQKADDCDAGDTFATDLYSPDAWIAARTKSYLFTGSPTGEIAVSTTGTDITPFTNQTRSSSVGTSIYSMATSGDLLFLSATDGVYRFDPTKGSPKLHIDAKSLNPVSLEYLVAYTDHSGYVYFGGSGGLVRIDPSVQIESASAEVYISRFQAGGGAWVSANRVPAIQEVILTHTNSDLKLHLSTSPFHAEAGLEYRHKLQNFDRDWINIGSRNEVTYTNIPPGQYTLLVEGANADGVWSSNTIRLPITVRPPWWQTPLAIASYVALFVLFLWAFKRYSEWRALRFQFLEQQRHIQLSNERHLGALQEEIDARDRAMQMIARLDGQLFDSLQASLRADIVGDHLHASSMPKEALDRIDDLKLLRRAITYRHGRTSVDIHGFVNDLIAKISADMTPENFQRETPIILSNIPEQPVSAEDGVAIGTAIRELLVSAVATARRRPTPADEFITVGMSIEHHGEVPAAEYIIAIESSFPLPFDEVDNDELPHCDGIIHNLIEQHEGSMKLEDYEGLHAELRLVFPADPLR